MKPRRDGKGNDEAQVCEENDRDAVMEKDAPDHEGPVALHVSKRVECEDPLDEVP